MGYHEINPLFTDVVGSVLEVACAMTKTEQRIRPKNPNATLTRNRTSTNEVWRFERGVAVKRRRIILDLVELV
jgi:hypothetical protein